MQHSVEVDKTQSTEKNANKSYLNVDRLIQRKSKKKCKNFKNWNIVDDNLLRRLFGIYGNKWKIIFKYFPNRTPYQLSYRMKTLNEKTSQKSSTSNILPDPDSNSLEIPSNSSSKNYEKLFAEIIENSFFEKLDYIKTNLKPSFSELDLNEKEPENNKKVRNLNSGEMKDAITNLGFFLRDVNYLSILHKENDKDQHFVLLLKNSIKTYISLIEKMLVNKEFFI